MRVCVHVWHIPAWPSPSSSPSANNLPGGASTLPQSSSSSSCLQSFLLLRGESPLGHSLQAGRDINHWDGSSSPSTAQSSPLLPSPCGDSHPALQIEPAPPLSAPPVPFLLLCSLSSASCVWPETVLPRRDWIMQCLPVSDTPSHTHAHRD